VDQLNAYGGRTWIRTRTFADLVQSQQTHETQ